MAQPIYSAVTLCQTPLQLIIERGAVGSYDILYVEDLLYKVPNEAKKCVAIVFIMNTDTFSSIFLVV